MRETSDSPEEPVNDLPGYADLRIGQLPPPPPSPSPAAVRVETPFTTLHSFSLRTGKGRPWLTLTIRSRATSTKYLPLFCDHDSITGELLLDLPATERVKGIVFIFKGSVTLTGQDEDFFIREETHLWLPPDGASTGQLAAGRHSLAVDFLIPTYIPTASRRGTVDRLPPTYTERASPVYVNYQLGISVRRPGISPNRKLVVGIGYLPREMAGRPSPLRLLAYQAGTPLLGPDDDLTGWRVLPPIIIEGTVFSSRIAMVEYTLAIASPLSFVVNSPIPLFLTIKSEDRHTLDLFASSQHEVCLTRVLSYAQEVNNQRSSNTFPTPVAQAVFWSHVQENSGNTRTLQGEIHIPKGTNPSFTFRKISLSYQLALLSPKIAGFAMTKTPDGPLVSEAIIVTVAAPKDVRIISQLPPRYAESGHGPNFNVTSGLLESGNMRFIHVHAG